MKYLKAKHDAYDYFNKNAIVKDELITMKERDRLYRYISDTCFTEVEIPKSKVFTMFGVRFEKRSNWK